MRRTMAAFGGMALAMTLLVTPVAAAPSQRVSDTETVLFCEGISNEAGTVFAFVAESETFGSFADLAFWEAPASPQTSEPTWVSVTGSGDFEGTSVTASFELVEFEFGPNPEDPPFGDPVGTATLEGTLTPIGDPEPYSINEGQGNHKFRREGVAQSFTVEGTLELPNGTTFDLSSCSAVHDTYTQFANSPASSVFHASQLVLDCHWEVEGDAVQLFAIADESGTFSDVFISGPDPEAPPELIAVPTSTPSLTTAGYDASFDLFEQGTGEPAGSAEASATLTPGGRINDRFAFDNFKVHITGQRYMVDGTLSLTTPDGTVELSMDDEACFAADQRVTEHQSARQGPKGKPLANDAPDGALPIAMGETVTVRTGGTALEPEAPCIGDFDGEPADFGIGKTAWWTFEGTGGDVTVDTAGSDYDTVLGIYVDDGGEMAQLACVDDVDSLQARITIPTEAGVTYFVQAGGLGGQAGTLVLSVN